MLEYAATGRKRIALRTAAASIAIVLSPCLLWFLYRLEFALEPPPPGNGYVLTEEARLGLGVTLIFLTIVWVIAALYLIRKALGCGSLSK